MMEYQQLQSVFHHASALLTYPHSDWWEELGTYQESINSLTNERIKNLFQAFMDDCQKTDQQELMERYVYTFDFGKQTNLYVTYGNSGERRERGLELLALKNIYKRAGFNVTDIELPDYLPLILEFASVADWEFVEEIITKYADAFNELEQKLIKQQSSYRYLLIAVSESLALYQKDLPVERGV